MWARLDARGYNNKIRVIINVSLCDKSNLIKYRLQVDRSGDGVIRNLA